jgi:hypothetical protein
LADAFVHSHPFATKAHALNIVADATSGPAAPDVEMIGAGVAFLDHGFETAPSGTNIFSIVRRTLSGIVPLGVWTAQLQILPL